MNTKINCAPVDREEFIQRCVANKYVSDGQKRGRTGILTVHSYVGNPTHFSFTQSRWIPQKQFFPCLSNVWAQAFTNISNVLIQHNENVRMSHEDACRLWRIKQKYAFELIQNKAVLVDVKSRKRYMCADECYDAFSQSHNLLQHPGRDAMVKNLQSRYANVVQDAVQLFCLVCNHFHAFHYCSNLIWIFADVWKLCDETTKKWTAAYCKANRVETVQQPGAVWFNRLAGCVYVAERSELHFNVEGLPKPLKIRIIISIIL
jgi:hypothetical protein